MTEEAKKKIEKGGDPAAWLQYLIKQLKRAEEISNNGVFAHPIKVTALQVQLYELKGIRNNFVMLLSIFRQLDPRREQSGALSNVKESVIQAFIAVLEKKYVELARLAKLLKDWNDPALMAKTLLEFHYPTREVNIGRNEKHVKSAGRIIQQLEKISEEMPSFFDNLSETRALLDLELQVVSQSKSRSTSGYVNAIFQMTRRLEIAESEIFTLSEQIQKEWPSKIEDNVLTFTPPSRPRKKLPDVEKTSTEPVLKSPPVFKSSISSSHISPVITAKILVDKKTNSSQEPPSSPVASSSAQSQDETLEIGGSPNP